LGRKIPLSAFLIVTGKTYASLALLEFQIFHSKFQELLSLFLCS